MQAADALLHDGVRRHLHEAIGAARVDHFAHQRVEPDHVGRGMRRRDAPFAHAVDDRRNQSRLVTQPAEEVVEQRGDGGLAVGAGDAHQMQFAAGMIVEGGRHVGHRRMGVGHRDVAHPFGQRFGQLLADDRNGARRNGLRNKTVSVGRRPRHGEEAAARESQVSERTTCPAALQTAATGVEPIRLSIRFI